MTGLEPLLIPIIVVVAVCLIIIFATERFSPDPFITKVVQIVVFCGLMIWLLKKLLPFLT